MPTDPVLDFKMFMVKGKFPIVADRLNTKRRFDTEKEKEAYSLLDSFSQGINNDFKESKQAYYDKNTKGSNGLSHRQCL